MSKKPSAPQGQTPAALPPLPPEGPLPQVPPATPTREARNAPPATTAPSAPQARTLGFDPAVWGGPPLRAPGDHQSADVWEEWVDTPDAEDYRRSRAQLQTDSARQRMRLNALKHGLCAKSVIVPGESAEAYDEMRADLLDQFRPDTPQEEMMVDQLAQAYWMLLRARRKEAELQAHQAEMPVWEWSDDYFKSVERFNRYRGSIERAYYRALAALQKFQKEWRKANPVGGHDKDRIKVLHIVYRTSDPESSYVMRIVSSSAKHGISYTEQIPLSEYRGGIYLRDDIPDEHLDEAA